MENFDFVSAFENFDTFLEHFGRDLRPCDQASDDIKALEDWAKILKDPVSLIESLGKNWLLHQKAIKKDIAAEKVDWAAANYFKAGADIADAVTLAIGPIKKEYLHILQ